ncbi:flavin-containing monooxygenase [Actinomycetospora sp. CA-084318]|uniref:flavin-containing monooxygenase n=1 Tax=Actinomycetospora sp. CA-084318 TaxID=3239892 RepID=UPI003D99F129
MKIAIVGAGFAGLSSAKVLRAVGHDVTVFEKAPDVGGVWSASRRYPGVTTQNGKDTYCLSDFPMPADYPEWPSGAQVQAYLADYARHFGLEPYLRLDTEVISADLADGSWTVTTSAGSETFDHLVVANGIFSEAAVPDFAGAEEFTAAGGRVDAASDFNVLDDAAGKHVVVVGYGKSACDIACALDEVSATTTVVARELLWKLPKMFAGVLNYKYLMLSRMGEALFRYVELAGFEKFLHGPGRPVRNSMLGSVQSLILRQCGLEKLGLRPPGTLEAIARSTVSLVTEGFYEKVAAGEIVVRRDTQIARLEAGRAVLTDGSSIPADVVVCGTGFHQRVPFLSEELQARITDDRGNFELYRQIQPVDVPELSFCGYNSSFFSPLSAEVAALWIAARLAGGLDLPAPAEQRAHIARRLAWMEERTEGKHARGTNIIPFSLHNIDEMLDDLGTPVRGLQRLREWLLPVDPADYAWIADEIVARHGTTVTPLRTASAA